MKNLFPDVTAVDMVPFTDRARLTLHLRSASRTLNAVLVEDKISTRDLKRMLLIESERKKPRPDVCRKLVARILSRERAELLKKLNVK